MTDVLADTVTRKSIPLTQRDLDEIAKLRGDAQARAELGALIHASVTDKASDAALLHTLIQAGLQAIRDRMTEAGYQQLANDAEYQEEVRAIVRSRRSRMSETEESAG